LAIIPVLGKVKGFVNFEKEVERTGFLEMKCEVLNLIKTFTE